MPPLLDGLYAYHKAPNLSWKELQYGLNKLYMNENGVSQCTSEALTLGSCDKQVELELVKSQEHETTFTLRKENEVLE